MGKSQFLLGELKVERFVRDEGRIIDNILKNYEKELEVLKLLVFIDLG